MIPGDLTAELSRLLRTQIASGALPATAATLTANGTWRPARAGTQTLAQAHGRTPGGYTTSLPFELASLARRPPQAIAAQLAEPLAGLPWISTARSAGGYLTVAVTTDSLAALPARIIAAGPDSARSDALAGPALTAPNPPDLAAAPDWPHAWQAQHDALVGRLAHAAGAEVLFSHRESGASVSASWRAGLGPPSVALACYGVDAVRYALAATPEPRVAVIESQLDRPLDRSNPFFLVRYAHANAASTLRWAADLGLATPLQPPPPSEREPAGLELIDAMSWLPERVAAAHRRRRPAELTAHLDHLASAWLDCAERHPALPFNGQAAPSFRSDDSHGEPAGAATWARLELAEAVRVILAAGLGLLTVAAPAMM